MQLSDSFLCQGMEIINSWCINEISSSQALMLPVLGSLSLVFRGVSVLGALLHKLMAVQFFLYVGSR